MLDELRHAARSLARSKGFTLTGSLTLALALGLATPIYSMLDGTIHPYTPIEDADRVVVIQPVGPPRSVTSYDRFRLIQTGTRFAQQMVPTVSTWQEVTTPTWRGQAHVLTVPGAYFDLLGIRPIMGRNFGNADRDAGAIILGVERWRALFPGRSTLDNASVSIDQHDYAVIGVMPERTGDVFLAMDASRPPPTPDLWVMAFARLKPGVDSAQ